VNRSRGLPLALGAAAVLALGAPAWGYVRTTSNSGYPLHWGRRSLGATVHANVTPPGLTRATYLQAVRAAANTWSGSALGCTDIAIQLTESDDPFPGVAPDGQSHVTFVIENWEYASDVLALTSVYSHGSVLFDGDIEINGVDHQWADVAQGDAAGREDVQNVLTHEFGHFLGFEHTCYTVDSRDLPRPVDNRGQPVPDCDNAPAEVQATTMFPSARVVGDTSKRDLAPDDIQAVCDVYPPDNGCSLGRHPGRAGGGGALALALLLGLPRRRRHQRQS
jgi:hypothetical protein